MRSARTLIVLVSLAAVVIAAINISCTGPAGRLTPVTAADTLARGKYLATIMGCGDCHTPGTLYGVPDTNRVLSGSELGWQGPWGVSFARNLTPDAETGLGSWTPEQIVNAVRTGMHPNGKQLLPPMPWPNYGVLTDEDAYSLAAYLKSLPPIQHRVPDAVPPGKPAVGSIIIFPPPSQWDVPPATSADTLATRP